MSSGTGTWAGMVTRFPRLPPVPQQVDEMRRKKLHCVHRPRPGPWGLFWSPSYGRGAISVATGWLRVKVDLGGTVVCGKGMTVADSGDVYEVPVPILLSTSRIVICDQLGCVSTFRLSVASSPFPSATRLYLAPMVMRCCRRTLAPLLLE